MPLSVKTEFFSWKKWKTHLLTYFWREHSSKLREWGDNPIEAQKRDETNLKFWNKNPIYLRALAHLHTHATISTSNVELPHPHPNAEIQNCLRTQMTRLRNSRLLPCSSKLSHRTTSHATFYGSYVVFELISTILCWCYNFWFL